MSHPGGEDNTDHADSVGSAAIKEEVWEKVRILFTAENHPGDRGAAEAILAAEDRYLPIVRATGAVDRDREETLSKIAGASNLFQRHKALIEVDLFLDDRLAIARSLLPATDSRGGFPVEVSYRNMQVFVKQGEHWECVAWQVTKVA